MLEYFRIVRRRGWLILLAALIAAAGAYYLAKRGVPVYQATAEVLLRSSIAPTADQTPPVSVDVDTELRVLRGLAVQQQARTILPHVAPISGASVSSTSSFTVSASSTDPQLAADSANAYANAYIKVRQTDTVNGVLAAREQIQARITAVQHQIDALGPPTTGAKGDSTPSASDVQRSALQSQLATYQIQSNELQAQVANLTAGAVVLNPATRPSTPIAPRPFRSALEGAAGGLIIGLGLAFLLEYLDDTLQATEALERLGGGLPVLGIIPTMSSRRERTRPNLVVQSSPSSPAAEAFRYLRTSLTFLSLDRPVSVIHVTSPSSRDGKTTVVANLAVAMAQAGQRVAVVDLDLRRPRIHEFFGLSNDVGFTSVAVGDAPLSAALRPAPGIDGLAVLTAGPHNANPSELLSSKRAEETIAMLRAKGWLLILDSPPLVPVADASVVSARADASVLVTSAGLTKKHEVKRSLEVLTQVRAPLVGTVLNRAGTKRHYYYYASSYYSQRSATGGPTSSSPVSAGREPQPSNGRPPDKARERDVVTPGGTSSSFRVTKKPAPTRRRPSN